MYLKTARGLGEYPGDRCYDPNRPAWLPGWISSPREFACVMGTGAANVYESVEYGTIPAVSSLPGPPAPNVPTSAQLASGSPDINVGATPQQWAAWSQAQRDALAAAERSGSWNPAGNLPLTASGVSAFFAKWGVPLLLGGLTLAGAVVVSSIRR